MRTLPALVAQLTHMHDAWIIGSSANPENEDPRDYDVVVPYPNWSAAALLLPMDIKRNTFGGFKIMSEGVEVDVWPGDLNYILTKPLCKYIWHPATGVRWQKI